MSVEPLALLINTLPEPMLLVSGRGQIMAANPPAVALFRLSPTTLLDRSLATLVANPPTQIEQYLESWARSRQLLPGMLMVRRPKRSTYGASRDAAHEADTDEEIVRHRCLGAVIQPWSEDAPAILLLRLEEQVASNSNFSLLTQKIEALSKEIRERMAAEQALRTSEKRFRMVVEAAPNAILVVDATGQIVLTNPQAERLFGYTHSELLGKGVEQLIPQRVRKQHEGYRRNFQSVPQARPMGIGRDLYVLCKDGSETPVEIGLNPFKTLDGEFVLVSIIDIRERKLAEAQLQTSELRLRELNASLEERVRRRTAELERSNDDLNQFASVASHDLKGPLRNIGQLADFIAEDAAALLPAKSQKHLARLRERVKRMDHLLDDLLTYARIGSVDGQVTTVALDALLTDVVAFLALPAGFQITQKGAALTLHTLRTPLELVIRNLISNAIKHHHQPTQGEVSITITDIGDFVEFRIADNGPGIDPQDHKRIFGLFQTLKPRDQVEGSGMGLAIVKKAVERQEGTIRVESTVGIGTTFIFTWPKQLPSLGSSL